MSAVGEGITPAAAALPSGIALVGFAICGAGSGLLLALAACCALAGAELTPPPHLIWAFAACAGIVCLCAAISSATCIRCAMWAHAVAAGVGAAAYTDIGAGAPHALGAAGFVGSLAVAMGILAELCAAIRRPR